MIQDSLARRLRRPEVRGKYLFVGSQKLLVRGTTYGTFRPDPFGNEYGRRDQVERDLAAIAANGFNALRTYTVPPRWLLDAAERYGLRVMIGLPWEQHVAFLDDRARGDDIERRVRAAVKSCAGHPAVLSYAVGNEIPAPIVRWHGRRRVERFLERLCDAVRAEDPTALVTYVNYPTTEYLELPFVDLMCFNVYLESQERLAGLPGAAPESGRGSPADHVGDRARQPAERSGPAGPVAVLAGPDHVRGRGGRSVRLRLDRRVASGRLRHRRLGLRPESPRPAAEARTGRRAAGDDRGALLADRPRSADLGRRVHVQRRAHHPRLPARASGASTIRTSK